MTINDSADALGRISRSSVTTDVAHRLIDYVRSGKISPGDRLPSERQLAADLGVGRSAIREALAALDLLGVIATRQGSGSYFNSGSSQLLPRTIEWALMLGDRHTLDLMEARRTIEVAIAGFAAQRATDDTIEALGATLATMEAASGDPDRMTDADLAFHLHLATMAGNSVLSDMLRSIQALLRAWISRGLTADDQLAHNTLTEHRAIYEAVRRRDADLARAVMQSHMSSAEARLQQSIDGQAGAGQAGNGQETA